MKASQCRFNPTGCSTRHYGCASEADHNRRAAAAAPLSQVKSAREREVDLVNRSKEMYYMFIGFRDVLLQNMVHPSARTRAVDPREVEPRGSPSKPVMEAHEYQPANVHILPVMQPFWLKKSESHDHLSPCHQLPSSVQVQEIPDAFKEMMVPYAHLPASVLQRCGSEVDGIEAEQEAAEQLLAVAASNVRADEVAAVIAQHGLGALGYAVGNREDQSSWTDKERICIGHPRDFSDDTIAWAVKCVGGHLAARKEVEEGLQTLQGKRIDLFLPIYVQWVAAQVTEVNSPNVTVRFW